MVKLFPDVGIEQTLESGRNWDRRDGIGAEIANPWSRREREGGGVVMTLIASNNWINTRCNQAKILILLLHNFNWSVSPNLGDCESPRATHYSYYCFNLIIMVMVKDIKSPIGVCTTPSIAYFTYFIKIHYDNCVIYLLSLILTVNCVNTLFLALANKCG